jgi:hypothetical protein
MKIFLHHIHLVHATQSSFVELLGSFLSRQAIFAMEATISEPVITGANQHNSRIGTKPNTSHY